jgi:hypothetical protein
MLKSYKFVADVLYYSLVLFGVVTLIQEIVFPHHKLSSHITEMYPKNSNYSVVMEGNTITAAKP